MKATVTFFVTFIAYDVEAVEGTGEREKKGSLGRVIICKKWKLKIEKKA